MLLAGRKTPPPKPLEGAEKGKHEYYQHFFQMVAKNRVSHEDLQRVKALVKKELLRIQKQMTSRAHAMTFDQLVNHLAEQGPLKTESCDPALRQKVHNTVLDTLK